jgi:hypothetical protein
METGHLQDQITDGIVILKFIPVVQINCSGSE